MSQVALPHSGLLTHAENLSQFAFSNGSPSFESQARAGTSPAPTEEVACAKLRPIFSALRSLSVSTKTNQPDEHSSLRKRRTVAWLLAGVVALMLAIIAAQQLLNLGPLLPPETG